jgi:hypothetical protein
MGKVRKDAAAEVEQDAAAGQARQSAQAAEHAREAREAAEAEQEQQARVHAERDLAAQGSVDEAREAEKTAKKQAAADEKAAGGGKSAS